MVSCKKVIEPLETPGKSLSWANLKDTASYTINGKQYTCNVITQFGRGNLGANRDSVTGYWHTDTLVYYTMYGFENRPNAESNDGNIAITFIKKYAKTALFASGSVGGIQSPKEQAGHYKPGVYQFVLDYNRFNHQNGVALTIRAKIDNQYKTLYHILLCRINLTLPFCPKARQTLLLK